MMNKYLSMLEKRALLSPTIKESIRMAAGNKVKLMHLKQLPFGAKREFVKDVKHFTNNVSGSSFKDKVYKAISEMGGPGFKLEQYPGYYMR